MVNAPRRNELIMKRRARGERGDEGLENEGDVVRSDAVTQQSDTEHGKPRWASTSFMQPYAVTHSLTHLRMSGRAR